jgi:hypothetical protein
MVMKEEIVVGLSEKTTILNNCATAVEAESKEELEELLVEMIRCNMAKSISKNLAMDYKQAKFLITKRIISCFEMILTNDVIEENHLLINGLKKIGIFVEDMDIVNDVEELTGHAHAIARARRNAEIKRQEAERQALMKKSGIDLPDPDEEISSERAADILKKMRAFRDSSGITITEVRPGKAVVSDLTTTVLDKTILNLEEMTKVKVVDDDDALFEDDDDSKW